MMSSPQAAAEYVTVTGQGVFHALEALAREGRDFIIDHPLLIGVLIVLALLFMWGTRPRVR